MFDTEVWTDVKGWQGYYQVSNFGRVRSLARNVVHTKTWGGQKQLPGKILKPQVNGGYYIVRLSKKGQAKTLRVHRLVAIAFVPRVRRWPIINHVDGNKLNNHYSNLEWSNNSRNMIHAYQLGLKRPTNGTNQYPKIA